MGIDFGKAASELMSMERKDWFKATTGTYQIRFLGDGEEFKTNFNGKVIDKVRFDVEVSGASLNWGVPKGKTPSSLYGQIVLLGEKFGSLKGQLVTLLVKNDGEKNEYTILESLELMKNFTKAKSSNGAAPGFQPGQQQAVRRGMV